MTENEMFAIEYFEHEMYKAYKNMLNILRNKYRMKDDEFSRKLRAELNRFDNCKDMREYYITDYKVLGDVYDVSN